MDTYPFTGRFDAKALHIAHALKQTEIQKSYNKAREKPIGDYLVSRKKTIMLNNLQIPTKPATKTCLI